MITVGIDLAAEPKSTAVVRLDWIAGPVVVDLRCPAADDDAVALSTDSAKIGIDCPLGWPVPFVEFVGAHQRGEPVLAADTIADRRRFAYRTTDLWCREQHGLRPLSVSADRIGHAALRCAGLLARLGVTDRSGAGGVVEVYPAGTLHRWHHYVAGYKRDPAAVADAVIAAAGVRFADERDRVTVRTSDHALDALVCALTARAAALGQVEPIPDAARELARVEGWIALPTCGLDGLVTRSGS